MPIFDIRIRHPHLGDGADMSDNDAYHNELVEFIDEKFKPVLLVSGLEQLNHFKDLIPYHSHIRMDCSVKSDKTVRGHIREFVEKTLGKPLENGDFKCGSEGATKECVNEPERFWRYPWKERRYKFCEKSPYDFQRSNELEMMAKDEFNQLAIYNCAKRDKDTNHKSLLERIIESIIEPLTTELQVVSYVHDYVVRLKQPYRENDIIAYSRTICLIYDIIKREPQINRIVSLLHK